MKMMSKTQYKNWDDVSEGNNAVALSYEDLAIISGGDILDRGCPWYSPRCKPNPRCPKWNPRCGFL